MLVVDPNQTFEATASINLNAHQASFGVWCKLLPISRIDALYKQWTGERALPAEGDAPGVAKAPVPPTLSDCEFIDAWLCGFAADVMDASGKPLAFTPANVASLLDMPGAKMAVIDAFLFGYREAETKNSPPPLAG